ncbi:helix-turn-helix domain-containing protein [Methylobacterium sp. WL6]|uniref:helix-turn-helix domain-containing protein n=1 Tax=Methylobacterium sp. WL6 TaxID=2603901 RepID=UPI0010E84AE1|nr:helix-turn-helix domain-containing protein [Methylobacterium sp. WL6]RYY18132.1 MAG: helix-turn-helix domain-containing protein [Alphaproteobacteria bacterium]TXN72037.1 helix-turn-helix domain-containing protein [Methylobacterium sp. WL6]
MNYAYEIRRQAEVAPRAALPAVASAMWKAFGEGHLSEAETEALSGLIEARQADTGTHAPKPLGTPRRRSGSRPCTDASMARRRRWAASGRLPPGIAARFTLAEQAVLAVIAVEVAKRGDCRLAVGHIAAIAGVSETMVRNAIREARRHCLLTVEERRLARFRSDTNVVCIVSREWCAWLRLARSPERGAAPRQSGGGCRSPQGTNTPVPYPVNLEGGRRQKGCRQLTNGAGNKAASDIRELGRTG